MFERITDIASRALKSDTVGNTFWLAASSAINGLIGAIIAGVLARFLGVEEYGTYTLIIMLLAMLTDVADLGVSSSIVRFGSESIAEGNKDKLRTVISIVARWKLIIGAVLVVVSLLFLDTIIRYVFQHVDAGIASYFRLSLVALTLSVLAGIFIPIYQSFKNFRSYSLILSSRAVLKLLLVLGAVLLFAQYSIQTLIWIEVIAGLFFLLVMYGFSPFKNISLKRFDKELEKKMFSFNKWISLYQGIALISGKLDIAFVGGLSDAHALGLYGAASKILGLMSLVASAYMNVLLTELSSSLAPDALKRKRRHAFAMVGVIIVGIACIILVAAPLVHLLFGEKFGEAAGVLRILCVGLMFVVLSYPLVASLFAMNKSIAFPISSILSTAVLVGGNMYLIPRFGVTGAAVAFTLSGIATFLCSLGFFFTLGRNRIQQQ
jgi:O-antigen/teichoic acid export membrane protein